MRGIRVFGLETCITAHTRPISAHHYSPPVQIQHVFTVSVVVVEFHWGFLSDALEW